MIETVLFDLDDTLLDFHRAEKRAITRTMRECGLEPDEERVALYSRINREQWKLLERGLITRDEVLTRRFSLLLEALGAEGDPRAMRAIYEKNLSEGHFFMPGALETLDRLSLKYPLYLVSNGTARVQDGRLRSAGILPYFREVFISERMGYVKPQKEYFDCCFAVIGEDKRPGAVIVGDSLTSDIRGGINAGIHTVWYNPEGKPADPDTPPEVTIRALSELEEALERL